jgi:hypothetical protein
MSLLLVTSLLWLISILSELFPPVLESLLLVSPDVSVVSFTAVSPIVVFGPVLSYAVELSAS